MNLRHSIPWVLILTMWTCGSLADDSCPSPIAGRFENLDHRYAFVVPADLVGHWQSPCSKGDDDQCICIGNHGLYIPLNANGSMSVFSAYVAYLDKPSIDGVRTFTISSLENDPASADLAISPSRETTLAGEAAIQFVATYRDRQSQVLYRKDMLIYVGPGSIPIEVIVSLTTPQDDYSGNSARFNELLNSFAWLPN